MQICQTDSKVELPLQSYRCDMRKAFQEACSIRGNYSVIVHGPDGCASDFGENACCTSLNDKDVVMGGEDKLEAKIREVIKEQDPELVIVLGTCVTALIGDDMEGIAKRFDTPVIAVETSGLSGVQSQLSRYFVFEKLIGTFMKDHEKVNLSVNYIGNPILDDEINKESEIRNCLASLGITLNVALPSNPSLEEIRNFPAAELNVFMDKKIHHFLGSRLEEEYSQQSILLNIPFGVRNTSRFFMRIADHFGMAKKSVGIIRTWERSAHKELEPYKKTLKGKRFAVIYTSPKFYPNFLDLSVSSAFAELGMEVTVFTDMDLNSISGKELHPLRIKKIGDPKEVDFSAFDMLYSNDHSEINGRGFIHDNLMRPVGRNLFYSGFIDYARDLAFAFKDRFRRRYDERPHL